MASILEYAHLANAVYDNEPNVNDWTRTAYKPSGNGFYDSLQAAANSKGGGLCLRLRAPLTEETLSWN